MNDIQASYISYLRKLIKAPEPLLVVCDTSNGSVGTLIDKFNEAKLHLVLLNEKVDGSFPAHGPNPMDNKAVEGLSMEVKRSKADFGVAFDADGDRAFFMDDLGEPVPLDEVSYLLSESFGEPYVLDVRLGQIFAYKKIVRSKVGHYFIKNLMHKKEAEFGAEASGHFYFKFNFESGPSYFDSGLRAFVEMVNIVSKLKSEGMSLSQKLASLPKFARSGELNFDFVKPAVFKKVETIYKKRGAKIDKTDGLTVSFPDENWWFNLRRSNTEDVVRLNLEAKDPKVFQEELFALKTHIKA